MTILDLVLTGIGLAMDAFAVSVCKGLSQPRFRLRDAALVGGYFGAFQILMPLIGFFVAGLFAGYIQNFDHWIAFLLLAFIGGKMIYESFSKDEDCAEAPEAALRMGVMLTLAIATSIDALAVGISFAFLSVNIWLAVGIIGAVTFLISVLGYKIGSAFGNRFQSKAELLGGVILVLIGVKILLEHLGVLGS